MLMAFSAESNLIIHQMDVVAAYLNLSEVKEDLFIEIPEKFEESLSEIMYKEHVDDSIINTAKKWLNQLRSGEQKTCKIRKALYKLRQWSYVNGTENWMKN